MGLEHLDTAMSFMVVMLLLSMLVTILVQCVIAISGLRGWNLHHGIKQLLEQLDPKLIDHSKEIAKSILEHPSISHMPVLIGGRRKATAIRAEELVLILKDLSKGNTSAAQKKLPTNSDAISTLQTVLAKTANDVPDDLKNRIEETVAELTKLFPSQAQAVQDAVNRAFAKADQVETQVKVWFGTIMDRTTERFLLYTRWITVAIAFTFAFSMHVDSIELFKQLSRNPELRAKLMQSVDPALQQAGEFIADQKNQKFLATDAIRALKNDIKNEDTKKLLGSVPSNLVGRKDGLDWLYNTLSEPGRAEALAAYPKRFEDIALNHAKLLGDQFKRIESSLGIAGIQLSRAQKPASESSAWYFGPGVFMSGLFLSLGAPFWFNALKQLANLRPAIASKVEKKQPEAG